MYSEKDLYGGPYVLYQVVCGGGRATVIARPDKENLPDDLREYPVHKGPLPQGACLTNLLYDVVASSVGLPTLRRKVIQMNADPDFVAPIGTRARPDEFNWFLIMENAAERAGRPRSEPMPTTNYNPGNTKGKWSSSTKVVDHSKMQQWIRNADFASCSEQLFDALLLDAILGIGDMAKRNFGVLSDGKTIFRFDTDRFDLTPERDDVCLAKYIREKEGQKAVFKVAQSYDLQKLKTMRAVFDSATFHASIHDSKWLPAWEYLNSSADAFLECILRRLTHFESDWKRFCSGILTNRAPKRAKPAGKEAGKAKRTKIAE
jgi:hypothetical protein